MDKGARAAIVTGGSKGIGKGIATRLLQEGWRVAVCDQDGDAGRKTVSEFPSTADVFFARADVSKEAAVKHVIDQTVKRFGRLDALVNNAALADPIMEDFDVAVWHKVLAVNLTGAFLCAKYAVPHLRKTRGSVINIASTRALMSESHTEAYSASKGGLVALTHSLAISLGPEIRVNAISPGWIDTKQAPLRAKDHAQHPVGRVGVPADVAALTAFLLSPEAGFITGQNYITDGGMTRKMIYTE